MIRHPAILPLTSDSESGSTDDGICFLPVNRCFRLCFRFYLLVVAAAMSDPDSPFGSIGRAGGAGGCDGGGFSPSLQAALRLCAAGQGSPHVI